MAATVPIIQTVQVTHGSGTITGTLSATKLNNTIIVFACTNFSSDAVSTVTDNGGNVYTKAVSLASPLDVEIWYAWAKFSTTSVVITYTGSQDHYAFIREYSGLLNTPLDRTTTGTGSGTSQVTSASTVTQYSNELVVVVSNYGISGQTLSVGAGYGNFASYDDAVAIIGIEDQVVSSVGAQTGAMTSGFGFNYTMALATFIINPGLPNNYQFVKVGDGMSVSERIR